MKYYEVEDGAENDDACNITWTIRVDCMVVIRLGSGEGLGDGRVVQ